SLRRVPGGSRSESRARCRAGGAARTRHGVRRRRASAPLGFERGGASQQRPLAEGDDGSSPQGAYGQRRLCQAPEAGGQGGGQALAPIVVVTLKLLRRLSKATRSAYAPSTRSKPMFDDFSKRNKAVRAALEIAAEQGWRAVTFPAIAARSRLSLAELR